MTQQVNTETTEKTVETVKIAKNKNTDLIKAKRKELNNNFKNMSQIWNYLRKNSGSELLEDYSEAKKVNQNVTEVAKLILNANLFGTFKRFHNEIRLYKSKPTTPSQCFDRLLVMSKQVVRNSEHGQQITDSDIETLMMPDK